MSINCTLLYLAFIKGRIRTALRDDELRWFIGMFLVSAVAVAGIHMYADGLNFVEAVRSAFFNTVSLQSTTGFSDEDFMKWQPTVWLILSVVSIVGACAGY